MQLFLFRYRALHCLLLKLIIFLSVHLFILFRFILLNDSTVLWYVRYSASYQWQSCWRWTISLIYMLNKTWACFMENIASYKPPTTLCVSDYIIWNSTSQSILNPPHCPLTYPTLCRFHNKGVVGDGINALQKWRYTTATVLFPSSQILMISESYCGGVVWFPISESMLTTPDNVTLFQLLGRGYQ